MAVIWVSERLDKGPMPASAVFQMGSRRTTSSGGSWWKDVSNINPVKYTNNLLRWNTVANRTTSVMTTQMVPRDSRLIASRERAGGVRNPHEDYGLWTLDCVHSSAL